ncbi:MAG: PqqD family protein [Pyrinomonadaceae bacterium]
MEKYFCPRARTRDMVIQESNEELLIYDLSNHKAYCLNPTSAAVWKVCDGKLNSGEIAELLFGEVEKKTAAAVVELALCQLDELSLIGDDDREVQTPNRFSRRVLIRNAALTTAVLLPVIHQITTPPAAHAQSGCVNPGGLPAGSPISTSNDTGCGQCPVDLAPQCCSGNFDTFVCTPRANMIDIDCSAVCT